MEQTPTKKRHVTLLLLIILVALVPIWWFWFTSLGDLLPIVSDDTVTSCYALIIPRNPGDTLTSTQMMELPVDSQGYAQLVALLDTTTYVRNPMDLLRLGRASDTQVVTLDPHYATIYFQQGSYAFSLDLFGPNVVVSDVEKDTRRSYFPTDGQTFQQEVIDLLLANHTPLAG